MRLVIKMQTSLFRATYIICTNFDVRGLQNMNMSHEGDDGGGIGLSYKIMNMSSSTPIFFKVKTFCRLFFFVLMHNMSAQLLFYHPRDF
jgi:hypothetical protein